MPSEIPGFLDDAPAAGDEVDSLLDEVLPAASPPPAAAPAKPKRTRAKKVKATPPAAAAPAAAEPEPAEPPAPDPELPAPGTDEAESLPAPLDVEDPPAAPVEVSARRTAMARRMAAMRSTR